MSMMCPFSNSKVSLCERLLSNEGLQITFVYMASINMYPNLVLVNFPTTDTALETRNRICNQEHSRRLAFGLPYELNLESVQTFSSAGRQVGCPSEGVPLITPRQSESEEYNSTAMTL